MATVSQFRSHVEPYVPQVSRALVDDAIRHSAINFCERTLAWRETLPLIDVYADKTEYPLDVGTLINTNPGLDNNCEDWRITECDIGAFNQVTAETSSVSFVLLAVTSCQLIFQVGLSLVANTRYLVRVVVSDYTQSVGSGYLTVALGGQEHATQITAEGVYDLYFTATQTASNQQISVNMNNNSATSGEITSIEVNALNDRRIVTPLAVLYDSVPVVPTGEDELDNLSPSWRRNMAVTYRYYMTPDRVQKLVLTWTPDNDIVDGLEVRVALKPGNLEDTVPEFCYQEHLQTIADGALSHLLSMQAERWYNQKRADGYERSYANGLAQAANEAQRSHTRRPQMVQQRPMHRGRIWRWW